MKALKVLLALGLMSGLSQAATITVSSGLPAQGFTVLVNGVVPANFNVAVGSFNTLTSTFTQFGATLLDTAKVNGVFSATAPESLNGAIIDVFVGTGSTIANSSAWVILRHTSNTAFPADVTGTGAVTFNATLPTVVTVVGRDLGGQSGFVGASSNLNLVAIPEPSAALLGALGVLGLIRRRR